MKIIKRRSFSGEIIKDTSGLVENVTQVMKNTKIIWYATAEEIQHNRERIDGIINSHIKRQKELRSRYDELKKSRRDNT